LMSLCVMRRAGDYELQASRLYDIFFRSTYGVAAQN
jgi:hypothetical protein